MGAGGTFCCHVSGGETGIPLRVPTCVLCRPGSWTTNGSMSKLVIAVLVPGVISLGCTPSVRLKSSDLALLRASTEVPVVHVVSRAPWVDCPGDWGERTWSAPGGRSMLSQPPSPFVLAKYAPAAMELATPAGTTWEDVQDQRTKSLRNAPPRDPARSTADHFLALSRVVADPIRFSEGTVPVDKIDQGSIERRFGSSPVLVFEATRWVLVGCFYTYQPWFNVRTTLMDPASGRVLWRDTCGGLYPPGPFGEASPSDLEANGKALYAQMMDARAEQCANELFKTLIGS